MEAPYHKRANAKKQETTITHKAKILRNQWRKYVVRGGVRNEGGSERGDAHGEGRIE